MGYTTKFTGEIRIHPPLNEAERDYLSGFSESRRIQRPGGPYALGDDGDAALDVDSQNRAPGRQPGLYCQWTPNADGTALVWDGHEKFYRSSAWMTYLIDTFLRPGAWLRTEMRFESDGDLTAQFADFTFDHVLDGNVVARGQDGAAWRIEVVHNEVAVLELNGPAPIEYVVFVVPRHEDYQRDREFDAAFDLDGDVMARIRFDEPHFAKAVHDCVCSVHPDLVPGDFVGRESLVDERIGLHITHIGDSVRIGLFADPGLADAERTFGLVQRLVAALTVTLGAVAVDPDQRIAVRPTAAYRDRAIDRTRGWTTEPDGRYAWGVV